MSKRITKTALGEGLENDRTDRARLDAMRDEDIDCSDIPETDAAFWASAELKIPENKERITVRIDQDVLQWLKDQGPGYQTRMNAILRQYMLAKTEHRTR